MKYTFEQILNGLDLYMETEYLETESGNSFFFTGGCYMLADAIHLALKENDIESKVMMIGEGLHNYVSSNGKLIDANGVSDDLDELLGKRDMGIEEDQDTTVEECGLFYKPYDKEVKKYKRDILKYTKLASLKLKKESNLNINYNMSF